MPPRQARSTAPYVPLAGALLLACGGDAGVVDSAGAVPEWTYRERLRLGGLEEVAAPQEVADVAVGPDGTIYVAQAMAGRVTRYGADGSLLGDLGDRGRGPGEFLRPTRMGVAENALWVADPMAGRISWWSPAGELLASEPAVATGDGPPRPWLPLHQLSRSLSVASSPYTERDREIPVVLRDAAAGRLDTLLLRRMEGSLLSLHRPGGGGTVTRNVVAVEDHVAVSPVDSAVVLLRQGRGGAPARLVKIGARGDTLFRRELARDVTTVVDEALLEPRLRARSGRSRLGERGWPEAAWRSAMMEALEPYLGARLAGPLHVGEDGLIWVGTGAAENGSTATWGLHDREGRPWARARLPVPARVRWSHGERAVAVWTDDLGIPYVSLLEREP